MKKLAIITIKEETGHIYAHQIERLLKGRLPVCFYSFEKDNVKNIKESVILLSTHTNYDIVSNHTLDHAEIIIPKMTLEREQIEVLRGMSDETDAYMFNLSAEMAIDTIALAQKSGIRHINFIPSFPKNKMLDHIKYVVTPGEVSTLGKVDKEVIDIGIRILDLSTILDILARLGLSHCVDEHNLQKYFDSVSPLSVGIEKLIRDTSELESQFNILLNTIDDYVVVTNSVGFIFFHCNKFTSFIQPDVENLVGSHISDYISDFDFDEVYLKHLPRSEFIVKINDIDTILEIRSMMLHGNQYFIHKLKKFSQSERIQANLRKKIYDMGHTSKYTFDDIKGESDEMKNTIHIAKRMANSFSSVLIIGETGTGKELFAQAIHNASPRSDGAFVAVNCGAFHENLFESELFGYEEGAFTGAKKGGKQGLFEIAHNGTLFLDEIGEMELGLQAKLLRVIQEKRIRRVGSESIIDVDVRIIAATNRDLMEEVKDGIFRKDLYYRLNVLPLNLIPLKDRKEDIVILFKSLQEDMGCHYSLSETAWDTLINHSWEGNVRELRNIVEYLNNLEETLILAEHLPNSFKKMTKKIHVETTDGDEIENQILYLLYQAHIKNKKFGRKTLVEALRNMSVFVSEQEIRVYINNLQQRGVITTSKGRGGTRISNEGIVYVNKKQLVQLG